MHAKPTISTIIPAYNRASDLPGAVATVMAQTYPVDEVIVVDDGSTDETRSVTRALPPIVRTIHQANQGVSAARNRGIQEASGDLIALLDTDDRWHPSKLEVQVHAMSLAAAEWSATNIQVIDEDGRPISGEDGLAQAVPVFRDTIGPTSSWFETHFEAGSIEHDGERIDFYAGDAFGPLLHGNFVFPSSVVMKRALVETAGLFDPAFPRAEETEYFLRLADAGPLAVVDSPLTHYRADSEGSLSASEHTVELTELALEAMDLAVTSRGTLTSEERRALRTGRRRILLDQAYAHIADFHRLDARRSLSRLREEGLPLGARGAAILLLSATPTGLLSTMRAAKVRLRSLRAPARARQEGATPPSPSLPATAHDASHAPSASTPTKPAAVGEAAHP